MIGFFAIELKYVGHIRGRQVNVSEDLEQRLLTNDGTPPDLRGLYKDYLSMASPYMFKILLISLTQFRTKVIKTSELR